MLFADCLSPVEINILGCLYAVCLLSTLYIFVVCFSAVYQSVDFLSATATQVCTLKVKLRYRVGHPWSSLSVCYMPSVFLLSDICWQLSEVCLYKSSICYLLFFFTCRLFLCNLSLWCLSAACPLSVCCTISPGCLLTFSLLCDIYVSVDCCLSI